MKELYYTNLGDVISFERGLTYSKADEVPESSIGVLRSNNVDLYNHSLNLDEIKFLNPSFVVPANKKVRKDSILMCMSNGSKEHLGKVAIIDKDLDYAFGGFMGLLTPNKAKVYPKYLYYTLISPDFKKHIRGLSDGANINNLKYADLSSFSFALFPIQEQQRIVGILDAEFEKIDALKANAEKNLQNAKDLFQAALKKELSCANNRKLSELYNICTGKLNSNEAVENGIYPFFTCSREVFSINTFAFDCDAILLAGNNASGDFNVKQYKGKFNAYQRTYVITAKNKEISTRLLYYVLTNYLTALKKMSLGANTKFLKLGMIQDINIPSFSGEETSRVINLLDNLDDCCNRLKDIYSKTISLCDDLKQALLRKAFSGEL